MRTILVIFLAAAETSAKRAGRMRFDKFLSYFFLNFLFNGETSSGTPPLRCRNWALGIKNWDFDQQEKIMNFYRCNHIFYHRNRHGTQ
jgi:hypothetical protein